MFSFYQCVLFFFFCKIARILLRKLAGLCTRQIFSRSQPSNGRISFRSNFSLCQFRKGLEKNFYWKNENFKLRIFSPELTPGSRKNGAEILSSPRSRTLWMVDLSRPRVIRSNIVPTFTTKDPGTQSIDSNSSVAGFFT